MDKRIVVKEKEGEKEGTILFIHGISSSSRVFDRVIQSEKIPYTMVSFDLPGHGKSYRAENELDYSLSNYKKTILEISNSHSDILLVGNSLGGHLALEVADSIDSLKGLVVFGAPPVKNPLNADEAFLPNPVLQYYFSEVVTDEQLDEAMNQAVQNPAVTSTLKEDFRSCDARVRSVLGKEMADGNAFTDEAQVFVNLHCPRYIFQGEQDPTVNPVYLEKLVAESNGAAELIMVENCGHYASLEHPELFIEKLADIASKTLD